MCLITGASSGFGLLASVELARRGFRVAATMRDPARRAALDAAMAAAGVGCEVVQLDVTDADSIDRAHRDVRRLLGPVEVLINNAGYGLGGLIEDLTMDEIRAQLETNFFGLVAVTKAVIPGMRERGRGRIIMLSSIAGKVGNPGFGAYAASKFAVEGLSESLRLELLRHEVYVSLIEPGTFRTDIFERNRAVGARVFAPDSPNLDASRRLEELAKRRIAGAPDPTRVAELIAEVAAARRPRLRYLVGRDARTMSALKAVMPYSALERIIARVIRPSP